MRLTKPSVRLAGANGDLESGEAGTLRKEGDSYRPEGDPKNRNRDL